MTLNAPKLGILAGGGNAPQALVQACRSSGRPFFVICLEGQAAPDFAADAPHAWIGLGAFGGLKKLCEKEQIQEIVMIGSVRRPSVSEVRPDWLGVKVLARVGLSSLGDDGLLRAIGKVIEEECGVRLIGAHDVFGGILTPSGVLTKMSPDAQAEADVVRGLEVARMLGQLDVGQSVLVQGGLVLGVEAIEGTDALIARGGAIRRAGAGGVLVKIAKPQQDERYDLPTVGPQTIENLAAAGFVGVAIEAGRSLLLDRDKTLETANKAGLFILGIQTGATND